MCCASRIPRRTLVEHTGSLMALEVLFLGESALAISTLFFSFFGPSPPSIDCHCHCQPGAIAPGHATIGIHLSWKHLEQGACVMPMGREQDVPRSHTSRSWLSREMQSLDTAQSIDAERIAR